MQHRILLVEDDVSILEMLQDYLIKDGFKVVTAKNGKEGVTLFYKETFDLIVVDIMMPELNGMDMIKIIREKSTIPVLIMSAKDTDVDKALGLGFGADDYIAKPFSMLEMSARIKAAIRRSSQYSSALSVNSNHFKTGELRVDFDNFSIYKNDTQLQLTAKEFDILKLFMTNPGRVFTKEDMYSLIWGDRYYGDENVIQVHIRRLRGKIEPDPSSPTYIKTLWGIGYRWEGAE